MSVEVNLDSPLAQALNSAIQPKLVEVGWSTGGADDSALAEYIILMLVNGKTQEQIAAELSGDLLNLGDDDPGARDFSQWLFEQVGSLNSQLSGGGAFPATGTETGQAQHETGQQDADMGDAMESADITVPTGPKSMRNGSGGISRPRDKRMLNQLTKAMDRGNESVLHRVRPQSGNERINTHSRGPPTGPRGSVGSVNIRGTARMNQNGRGNGMSGMNMQPGAAQNVMGMSPQQQLELYAMLEQQSRIMAQMFTPQQQQMMAQGAMGNGMGSAFPAQGRPLQERMQHPNRSQNNGFQKRNGEQQSEPQNNTSMDVEMSSQDKVDSLSPDTPCRFNLSCTNKDCKFAHQSPAAPPGTAIDVSDVCSFGAACKNRKCVARHPSPAQKIAHQTELDCKFFPNCTNARCPFRHPSAAMPLCRNGADCTTPNCKFTHVTTPCKFNPCLNATCSFKHEEGQKRGKFDDKVWVADNAKEHVSERKFVDEEGSEELIVPGGTDLNTANAGGNGDPEIAA